MEKKQKTSSSPKTIIYYTKFTTYYSRPNSHYFRRRHTAHFAPDNSFFLVCWLSCIYIYTRCHQAWSGMNQSRTRMLSEYA